MDSQCPVPIVDLSELDAVARGRIDAVGAAARDCGFFQVTGHGVSSRLVDRVWAQTHAFFDLPPPAKQAIARTKENPRGYYDRELTKNRRDLKEVLDFAAVPAPAFARRAPQESRRRSTG